MSAPEIRSQMLPMFLASARAAGVPTAPILRELSLPSDSGDRREVQVPLAVLQELTRVLSTRCGDPWLGLHVAASIHRGAYGLPEYVWRNAPTVREMFLRLHRYSLLLDEATTNTFRSERGEAILELSAPLDPSCLGRHGNELAMAFIVRVLKETMPASWRPRRLWFAHAAPDDHTPLSAYFRTRNISFGCRANGIALDAADLDVPLTGADPALFALLDEQARSGVEGQRHPDDFQTRLRDHLGLALRDGLPCLDDVAASVGMSARTLQRRLAEEGTHFGAFLDDVRRNLAFVYLVNRHLELSQIADLLRYSDVGTFVRAFRRWTGTTPGEYRKQHVRGE